jgi:trehalose-phosphatase
VARLLPNHLLVDLLERKRLLLCLDFDGTIAATTANPDDARPVEGVADVLRALSSHREDVVLAIVSGRDVRTASRMLGVSGGLYFVGLHGIELLDPDNHRELLVQVKHCLGALHTVREWLAKVARTADGFKIEDKECSLALHFRNVDPETARDICRQLEYFVVHMIR